MDIAAVVIVALRLIAPFSILRFPLIGTLACAIIDGYDHGYIGEFEYYQIADKWLDLYYLAFAYYVSRGWRDQLARKIAKYLFVYRALGVAVLTVTNLEWTMILFPNLFEMFFVFYLLYLYLSSRTQLLANWKDAAPMMAALLIPKMLQEYALHVHPLYRNLTPDWIFPLFEAPRNITMILWFILPLLALWYYVRRAKKPIEPQRRSKAQKADIKPEAAKRIRVVKKTASTILLGMIISLGIYTVSLANTGNPSSSDSSDTKQITEAFLAELSAADRETYADLGAGYIEDGETVLGIAEGMDCKKYAYEWESSTLTCQQGVAQLAKFGETEVSIGKVFQKIASQETNRTELLAAVDLIDRQIASYDDEIIRHLLEAAEIQDNIRANTANKETLESLLNTDSV